MRELTFEETCLVSGGVIPVAVGIGLFVKGTAFGAGVALAAIAAVEWIKN